MRSDRQHQKANNSTSNGFQGNEIIADTTGYNRPRRPNVDTITYLRGLPLDVVAAEKEISNFLTLDGSNAQYPQSLAAVFSAIDEIRMEVASLAGDEYGSQCLEVLAQISAPFSETAARILINGCSGYHLHLATHRYGSHVLQTILQLAVSASSETDLALHDEAPQFDDTYDSLPPLVDLIQSAVEELAPHASVLAVHVCGSHVLRTLLCVIGGVDLVSASRKSIENKADTGAILRGKKKSKKRRKKPAEPDEVVACHAGTMNVVYQRNSRIKPSDFFSSLKSVAVSLMGSPSNRPGELQQLACHPSAGPLLIILLRVLAYAQAKSREDRTHDESSNVTDFRLGIVREEPKFEAGSLAHQLVQRLLCWQVGSEEQKYAGDVIYGLSGEPRGSHLLETMLRLSPNDVHDAIVTYGDFENQSLLQDYIEHDVSNFVIQTLLTTIRTKEKAESMLRVIEKVIASGLLVDCAKKRRGVLWRAVELAARYRVGQEGLLKAIRLGFGTLNDFTEANDTSEVKNKKLRKKSSAVEIKECVPLLIDIRKPENDGSRILLDPAGARSVYHLLRFSPRLCEDVLKGIIDSIEVADLVQLAKDGLGSRCILDGILEGPVKAPVFAAATKSLLVKLKGSWVSLSADRVGHHSVKKLFRVLPKIDDKAMLVDELASGGSRLTGNAMGRNVIETCFVDKYRDDRKEWRKAVSKMIAMEQNFLSDTFDADDVKTKRKRKR